MYMKYFPKQEIVPGLWIGSEADSWDAGDYDLVVNCTRDLPFDDALNATQTYRIPIWDSPDEGETLLKHLPIAVRAIDQVLSRKDQKVLVHCRAGMQRSAATVAAYLMFKYNLTARDAMAYVRSKKNETFWPEATFANALQTWEKVLAKNNRNA